MSYLISTRRTLLGSKSITYLLRDEFDDTVAAGDVHLKAATPGPGTRTVTDTGGDELSVGSGVATFANPNSLWDAGIVYDAQTRAAGRIFRATCTPDSSTKNWGIAWKETANVNIAAAGGNRWALYFLTTARITVGWITSSVQVGIYVTSTEYSVSLVVRTAGMYYFIKGGAFTAWTLLWVDSNATAATIYPVFANASQTGPWDSIRIPDRIFIPPVALYDTFTRANGVLGDSETVGPDSQPVTARTWESGGSTWAIASNEAVNTPTETGVSVLNADMEAGDPPNSWTLWNSTISSAADERTGGAGAASLDVAKVAGQNFPSCFQSIATTIGTWYSLTGWRRNVDSPGGAKLGLRDSGGTVLTGGTFSTSTSWNQQIASAHAIGTATRIWLNASATGGADGVSVRFDDMVLSSLTLNELFTDVDDGATSDYLAEVELDTVVTSCGMVLNLDDKDTPANFVIGYHDGTNAKLDKCVAGTYTSVITAAATYAAGAKLVVIKEGTSFSLFYNNAKVGSTSTISDAGIISNTKHGLFSTNSGNQLDNFNVFYRTHPDYDTEFDNV